MRLCVLPLGIGEVGWVSLSHACYRVANHYLTHPFRTVSEEEFSEVHFHHPVWFGLVGPGFSTSTRSDESESTLHVVVLDKDA